MNTNLSTRAHIAHKIKLQEPPRPPKMKDKGISFLEMSIDKIKKYINEKGNTRVNSNATS